MAERDADEGITGSGGSGMNDGPSAPRELGDAEGLSGPGGARARADGSDIGNAAGTGSGLGRLGGAGEGETGGAGSGTREGGASGGT